MLSGEEILKEIEKGNIIITPFERSQLNPNSYNLTLGDEVTIFVESRLDVKIKPKTKKIPIPEEGLVLMPNNLYLISTNEYTETYNLVPQISGRSSIGRVGLAVHTSAGYSEAGYCGKWHLSMFCSVPVKIFKGMQIGQIYYFPLVNGK